jgi:hypothetical protein
VVIALHDGSCSGGTLRVETGEPRISRLYQTIHFAIDQPRRALWSEAKICDAFTSLGDYRSLVEDIDRILINYNLETRYVMTGFHSID